MKPDARLGTQHPSLGTDLSRRPGHGAAAEEMEMNMKNGLPRGRAAVEHDAKAVLRDALLLGEAVGDGTTIADELVIVLLQLEQRRDVLHRHDQDMDRRLGPDVLEGDDRVVAIDDVALDLPFDDAAKKTVAHRPTSAPFSIFQIFRANGKYF